MNLDHYLTVEITALSSTLVASLVLLVSVLRVAGRAADRQKAIDAKLSSKSSGISAEFVEKGGGAGNAKAEEPDR